MSDFVHGPQADVDYAHDVKHTHRAHDTPDVESGSGSSDKEFKDGSAFPDAHHVGAESADEIKAREIRESQGFFRTLRRGEEWLDEKMGIETQGIDRIREEDKRPPSLINMVFLWWSMTCHVGVVPIGVLGPEFGLSLNQSMSAIVVGTCLGTLCTAFCATLGPKLGLRSMATARYSFGFYGAKLCSVLNVIIGGGFAVVNTVVVGQLLAAVSNYTMSLVVGCIIIGVLSYVVSIFGFAIIHTFEKYAWIMTFTLLCVLIGQVGDKVDASLPALEGGLGNAGSWLSFMAICFSSASGWCSLAADYYCNYPADTKTWKIFTLTFFGVSIPTTFATVIGACLGNAALTNSIAQPLLNEAYEAHGLGGLLRESYHPTGFAKFCLVFLVFSVLGNNIAVNYSSGLSLQLLGHHFHAVPRFIWSFLNALVITVLAIAGRAHLSTIVSNFVSLLGYWTVSFTIILLLEDRFFRRTEGYNLNAWDLPNQLPWGAAAVLSLLAGYLCGGVPGMSQTWYVGPVARKFGPFGGDVGIYMSAAITLLVYTPARWYERKISHK
ncbi:hypothetical protein LZ554_004904 [Drepanopeziza brunnea f. sp. 'monogermtubi']|nr:hypothetical protein LZ554_004904 [Drepanopeziza brunnea f. sp. 'monogermtubi']